MRSLKTLLILSLFLLFGIPCKSQDYLSPRGLSFAQTYATQSRGVEAIGWNPANLGVPGDYNFQMNFGAFPLVPLPMVQIGNSSLSASFFNRYYTGNHFLDARGKSELLAYFPESGWSSNHLVQLRPIGISIGHTAVALDGSVTGSITLPRALLELALYGNEFGKPVLFDGLNGEVQATTSLAIAHGREVTLPGLESLVENTTVGAAVKLLIGMGYIRTESADASLITNPDGFEIQGKVKALSSFGMADAAGFDFPEQSSASDGNSLGYGMAIDLGIGTRIHNDMRASLALNNLLGALTYPESRTYEYEVAFNSDTVDMRDPGDLEKQIVKVDTSYVSGKIRSPYPAYLVAGYQWDYRSDLSLYLNYKQGFTRRLQSTPVPRLSVASEYRRVHWLPLRLGMSIGGIEGFQWGAGFGFEFSHYGLHLGFSQSGGVFNHATGFSFALGQELRF